MKRLSVLLSALIALLASSCDTILQYPEEPDEVHTTLKARIVLNVDFSPVSDPITVPYSRVTDNEFDVRYQVAVYALDASGNRNLSATKIWTDDIIAEGPFSVSTDMELDAKQYEVYAWIDFVPIGTKDDYHYITTDSRKIVLSDPNVHGLDSRDAFAGKVHADLRSYGGTDGKEVTVTVDMERPFGKFIIVSTDMNEFQSNSHKYATSDADISATQTLCRYTSYFPTSYNLDTRFAHPEDFKLRVNHLSDAETQHDGTIVLTGNYVFVCNSQTTVTADIEITGSNGKIINTVRNITIPIERNRLTVISGQFLTGSFGSGGFGIDDNFEGEIVIVVP